MIEEDEWLDLRADVPGTEEACHRPVTVPPRAGDDRASLNSGLRHFCTFKRMTEAYEMDIPPGSLYVWMQSIEGRAVSRPKCNVLSY
jgi:hypothetical protein